MTDITISEVTDASIGGVGTFDKFMTSVSQHIKKEFDDGRINASNYSTVYLGGMQSALAESVKFVIGRQLASAQADLAIANKVKVEGVDTDLITAEIANKGADTDNRVTENGLILEKITNLEADTAVKEKQLDKMVKEIEKLTADITLVEKQKLGIIASTSKTDKEVLLLDDHIAYRKKELTKLVSEINQIDTRVLNIECETVKCNKETLRIIEDTSLIGFRAATEKANVDGTDVISNSLVASKINLAKYQAATEKANVDGGDLTSDSYKQAQIDKMVADAANSKAKYDNEDVVEGSLMDCETKLACARATSEEVKYTAIGSSLSNGVTLSKDSMLGAQASLIIQQEATEKANTDADDIKASSLIAKKINLIDHQSATEKANIDGTDVKTNSVIYSRINEIEYKGKSLLAQYDPVEAGVKTGSKLDCDAKLQCARTDTEKANFTVIGTNSGQINPKSILGSKVQHIIQQTATEKAETDATDVVDGSMYKAKIAKMEADAKSTKAQYDTTDVKEGSILQAKTDLTLAQATAARSEFTKIGESNGEISADTKLGAEVALVIAKAATEKANIDGSDLEASSLIAHKIKDINATTDLRLAEYRPSEVNVEDGSKLHCQKKLLCAQATQATSEFVTLGTGTGFVEPDSLLGSKIRLMQGQATAEKAQYDTTDVQAGSYLEGKAELVIAQAESERANFIEIGVGDGKINPNSKLGGEAALNVAQAKSMLAKYDPVSAGVKDGSLLDCEKKLTCAKATSEAANYTAVGSGGSNIPVNSLIGAKAKLLENQAITESGNYLDASNGGVIGSDSLIGSRGKLLSAQATAASAEYTAIGDVEEGDISIPATSVLGAKACLLVAQAKATSAEYVSIVDGVVADNGESGACSELSSIPADSFIGSKASLANAQAKAAAAEYTGISDGGGDGSFSVADNSLIGARVGLLIAQKISESANYTAVGDGEGAIASDSLMGAKTQLAINQGKSEAANYTGVGGVDGIDENSILGAKANLHLKQALLVNAQTDNFHTSAKAKKATVMAQIYAAGVSSNPDAAGNMEVHHAQTAANQITDCTDIVSPP